MTAATTADPNTSTPGAAPPLGATADGLTARPARRALAVLRLATGFIFLWAFLDKTFGLGFSTPAERAWLNGGTPSQGFLASDSVTGPLKSFFAGEATRLAYGTDEAVEGRDSFLEKREPDWSPYPWQF